MFNYTSNGQVILFGGCAAIQKIKNVIYKFAEGSIAFDCMKSRKGILEKIAIKKVLISAGKKTLGQKIIVYMDTYNSLYNEEDLCTKEEAVNFSILYYENLYLDVQKEINKLNCTT